VHSFLLSHCNAGLTGYVDASAMLHAHRTQHATNLRISQRGYLANSNMKQHTTQLASGSLLVFL